MTRSYKRDHSQVKSKSENKVWTEDECERLLELWAMDVRTKDLCLEFPDVSRSALLGKVARLRSQLGAGVVRARYVPRQFRKKRTVQRSLDTEQGMVKTVSKESLGSAILAGNKIGLFSGDFGPTDRG